MIGRGALVALLLLGACDQKGESLETVGKVRHENGLVVPRLAFLDPALGAEGLLFTDNRDIRQPLTVDVALSPVGPPEEAQRRGLDGAEAYYAIEELGSYSGGTEYRIRAWRPVGSEWIVLTAEQQNEGSAPDFAAAWAMLRGARVER
jgi:hypothetical protein